MTSKMRTAAGHLATSERYELLFKIGTGGAATVYLGRRRGPEGFSRLVAVKRAHPHLQGDPAEQRARLREASVASRLHHANVVATQDVELSEQDLLLVMDYVEGASLSELLEATVDSTEPVPLSIVMRVALDACAGLRAVHELTDEHGRALSAIHRDISPQNILVGTDGLTRISDFGLAKLAEAASHTSGSWRTGSLAGKLAYLAPELVQAEKYDARCDLFSFGIVLWEAIASRRLFGRSSDPETAKRIVKEAAPDLSRIDTRVPVELARIVARALEKKPESRWQSARELAEALQDVARRTVAAASGDSVGQWVEQAAAESLSARRELIRQCTEDTGDRPSVDFAFAGTASMVGDPGLDDAVSPAPVTEGSVTAPMPIALTPSEPPDDAMPEDELTASERDTIAPSPASIRPSEPRPWRLVVALAAIGFTLIAGLWWMWPSSSVPADSTAQDAASPPNDDSGRETPQDRQADVPSTVAAPRPREAKQEADIAPPSDREPHHSAETPRVGKATIDLDAPELDAPELDAPEPDEPIPPTRATPSDSPRANTPKPPANPYRR